MKISFLVGKVCDMLNDRLEQYWGERLAKLTEPNAKSD